MNKENIIIFGDSVGRLLIGEKVNESDTQVTVTQPYVIDVSPQGETAQMGIRFIPSAYLELFEDGNGEWQFPKGTHSFNNLEVSVQAVELYVKIVEMYNQSKMSLKEEIKESADNVISMVD
jgi:hypothetical protein